MNDFDRDFYKLFINSVDGETKKNVGNRIKLEFIKKDEKIVKQQSKSTFNGIHKSYKNYNTYTFKKNEVFMDKPIYLGFA